MPRLQTPCGMVDLPDPTPESLATSIESWVGQAGDAFVAGMAAVANGKLERAAECFLSTEQSLARARVIMAEAVALAKTGRAA
jgi:hypothetical protein